MQFDTPLGKPTVYTNRYSPELICPILRAELRKNLGIEQTLPFNGVDSWTAYELSWLDPRGKPQIAIVRISYPCTSAYLIESKSLKLYFNSFHMMSYADAETVKKIIIDDLSQAVKSDVTLEFITHDDFNPERAASWPSAICLDNLAIDCTHYQPTPELLQCAKEETMITERLYSNLLKSDCLATGQPDWGSVVIEYTGTPIDHSGLLRYIVSSRQHQEFHEHCVERMFCDIQRQCQPQQLTVYARYVRRGGLDINPYRSTQASMSKGLEIQLPRQ